MCAEKKYCSHTQIKFVIVDKTIKLTTHERDRYHNILNREYSDETCIYIQLRRHIKKSFQIHKGKLRKFYGYVNNRNPVRDSIGPIKNEN